MVTWFWTFSLGLEQRRIQLFLRRRKLGLSVNLYWFSCLSLVTKKVKRIKLAIEISQIYRRREFVVLDVEFDLSLEVSWF